MNPLSALLDFLKPEKWRLRPAAQPEANDVVLSRLGQEDPVYRALMDHAYASFEEAASQAMRPDLTSDQRIFCCGAMAQAASYCGRVEGVRERAREWAKQQQQKQKPE